MDSSGVFYSEKAIGFRISHPIRVTKVSKNPIILVFAIVLLWQTFTESIIIFLIQSIHITGAGIMDIRLFSLHTSSYLYLVLSYMAAQGALSRTVPAPFDSFTVLNLLYMVFASIGMTAFGFFHNYVNTKRQLFALLLINGSARMAMELLSGEAASFAAVLFLLTCGWMLAMVLHLTSKRVPTGQLGRFVGGSMTLATVLMFLLSLTREFFPFTAPASASAYIVTALLLWTGYTYPALITIQDEDCSPNADYCDVRHLLLLVCVAALLSFAYGINDSTSYLRFEEFRDDFGLSRLALGAGLFLAGYLADHRRAYLPLAAVLGGAATMAFHAMTLEGFPAWLLFCANEFFWGFGLLFILITFMEISLRTSRPSLWAGMGRLIEMPSEGLGALLGTAMQANLPVSAVLTVYTLTLASATALLYHELLSHRESIPSMIPPLPFPASNLSPVAVGDLADSTEAESLSPDDSVPNEPIQQALPLSEEALVALWKERYTLTNRETEILQASLSGDTAAAIGKAMFITTATVRFHLTHLLKKTGYPSRKELVEAFEQELAEKKEL